MSSLTIPIGQKQDRLSLLEKYQDSEASIIKVKVGENVTSDIKGLNILLKTIEIMSDFVDANQGYSLRSAIKIADKLQK